MSKNEKHRQDCFELDELHWFIKKKAQTQTRENIFIMTMIRQTPRQIVGFYVKHDKSAFHLQGIVDGAESAESYCTDGYVESGLIALFMEKHSKSIAHKSFDFLGICVTCSNQLIFLHSITTRIGHSSACRTWYNTCVSPNQRNNLTW